MRSKQKKNHTYILNFKNFSLFLNIQISQEVATIYKFNV